MKIRKLVKSNINLNHFIRPPSLEKITSDAASQGFNLKVYFEQTKMTKFYRVFQDFKVYRMWQMERMCLNSGGILPIFRTPAEGKKLQMVKD